MKDLAAGQGDPQAIGLVQAGGGHAQRGEEGGQRGDGQALTPGPVQAGAQQKATVGVLIQTALPGTARAGEVGLNPCSFSQVSLLAHCLDH